MNPLLIPLIVLAWFPIGCAVLLWAAYVSSATDLQDGWWCFVMVLFWPVTMVFAMVTTIFHFVTVLRVLPLPRRFLRGYYEIAQMTKRKGIERRNEPPKQPKEYWE